MRVSFRDKALMALESMSKIDKLKAQKVIDKLKTDNIKSLHLKQLKGELSGMLVARIGQKIRMLILQEKDHYLIIDIVQRSDF